MDFSPTTSGLEFEQLCRRFATEVIRPVAPKHDAEESQPWEVMKEARKWGLLRSTTSSASGWTPTARWWSSTQRRCTSAAPDRSRPLRLQPRGRRDRLQRHPEQVQQWVPECFGTGDEIKMGAYAVTEPQAGSDVRSLRSTAKPTATSGS